MDKEAINKIEEILEKHLFMETNNPDYELKKIDVIIKYLIYQKLKDIDETLKSIDENLFISANKGIYEE